MALSRKSPTRGKEDILRRTWVKRVTLGNCHLSLLSVNKYCRTHVIKIRTFRDNMIPHVQRYSTHNNATQFLDAGVKVVAEPWGKGDINKHFEEGNLKLCASCYRNSHGQYLESKVFVDNVLTGDLCTYLASSDTTSFRSMPGFQ